MGKKMVSLGRGVLGAPSWERHSDRNGVVHLSGVPRGFDDGAGAVVFDRAPVGKTGDLVALVIDDRDKARPNTRPWGPRIIEPSGWKAPDGAEVVIGHGVVFTETLSVDRKPRLIGVKPLDGRAEDWLTTIEVWHSEVELLFREGGSSR